MTAPYPRLFEPITIRRREIKNRIVSTAHNPNWEGDGLISEKHVRYHVRKAAGGAGLVMTFGSADVHKEGGAFTDSVKLWEPANEAALRQLAEGVHRHGAAVISQASHLGHRGNSLISGRPLQAPSEVPQPVRREIPHVLKKGEIKAIVTSFAEAARRLERCGWDGIEITSFGGHLIEQFWSPRINRREDEYGGDLEGRMRFSIEIVEAVGGAVSDRFMVGVRMTGDPLYNVIGLGADDMLRIAQHLDGVGRIDFFNISGGTGSTLESQAATVPGDTFARACYLPLARRMKQHLSVPVLAAGRILDLEEAEAALAGGDCDLIAMTRAIIADPDLPKKAAAGEVDRIRPCIAINEGCIGRDYQGYPMLCAVNPAIAWPELDEHTGAQTHECVVVVGAGPAGMEAARVAASRHRTTLLERSHRVGGQIATAARAHERPLLGRHIQWLERELERLGVAVRLGAEGTVDSVLALDPSVVVLATGATSGLPTEVQGVNIHCVTDVDLLEGRVAVAVGSAVLVYDPEGLNRGGSIANFAAEAGAASVELATPLLTVCQDLDPTQQPAMLRRLARNRVVCSPNHVLVEPEGGRLVLKHAWSEEKLQVEADLAVFVGYRRAASGLEDELRAARPDLQVLMAGDCIAPRRLHDAVAEGVSAGNAAGQVSGERFVGAVGVWAYASMPAPRR